MRPHVARNIILLSFMRIEGAVCSVCSGQQRGPMALQTELTARLGLRHPIIAAPLGRGSTPEFLAALARAGAIGFVALMHMREAEVRQILSRYVAATGGGRSFGVNLVLIIDQMRRPDAALETGCRVVSLLMGDPGPYVRRAKEAGATVFC